MSSFCPSSQNLRVAFSGKLKCLQHYTTSTSRFQHVSNTYQTLGRYSQCIKRSVLWSDLYIYTSVLSKACIFSGWRIKNPWFTNGNLILFTTYITGKENMLYPLFLPKTPHLVGMIKIITAIITPTVILESFGYSFNNWWLLNF